MKKLFTVFALALLINAVSFAQDADPSVLPFLNSLKVFLLEEGYASKIDEDGDLQFKSEGDTYWYSVSQNSDGTFYVRFCRASMGATDADMYAVYRAANQVTAEYKCGKCYVSSGRVRYSVEFFAESPAYAKRFFSRHLSILGSLEEDCKKYYSQYSD